MATAEELLASISDESNVLTVNLDTRIISIPATIGVLGVESDDDVRRLRFKMPRHYGDIDLSEFSFQINFKNTKGGTGDFYPASDVIIGEDTVEFNWLVNRTAFNKAGDVEFSICMKKYDAEGTVINELNTTTAVLPVLKGLETTKEVVEKNPSAFDAVLFRLYAVEAASGLGQDSYYTIAKVEEHDYGVNITIIDKNGTTVATITHGIDGYTPVKGVDYWTPDEQGEIKADLQQTFKAYIDNWSPSYKTITLTKAEWSNNRQTVQIEDVKTGSVVFVAPEPSNSNYVLYSDAAIRCIAQGDGSLTFTCETVPEADVLFNVAVYFSLDDIAGVDDFTVSDDGEGNVAIM